MFCLCTAILTVCSLNILTTFRTKLASIKIFLFLGHFHSILMHIRVIVLSTAVKNLRNVMYKCNLNYNFTCRSIYNAVAKVIQDT